MSVIFKTPLANTMAFGGVPTGNTKTNEQAIVTGNIKARGWVSVCWA
jgi:hypothetical protein